MLSSTAKFYKQFYGDSFVEDLSNWEPSPDVQHYEHPTLTDEQQLFIQKALEGNNILVDACVGSGKTTSIQALCDALPTNKKILYLTYSKLLKIDARNKIRHRNVEVTNYHGLAWRILKDHGISAGVGDMISILLANDFRMPHYDVMIVDEYQDLETAFAKMLVKIKEVNPNIQLVFVGDMKQRISNRTPIYIPGFISDFLGEHIDLEFTKCFRLCPKHAERLSKIWDKKIVGVNNTCKIAVANRLEVAEFLSHQDPKNVLCLGQYNKDSAYTLNDLEENYPDRYNKHTVFAAIRDQDKGSVVPNGQTAIFTTYDASKGLERKICVIYNFTPSYWNARIHQPDVVPEILQNIFMVAASRGKELIIFVENKEEIMDDDYIPEHMSGGKPYDTFEVSSMFDFKFPDYVEDCFNLLHIEEIPTTDHSQIEVRSNDALIDLAPCIGVYQEAFYFNQYDMRHNFELFQAAHPEMTVRFDVDEDLEHQILDYIALQTSQNRYQRQVLLPLVTDTQADQIRTRLDTQLSPDEDIQRKCSINVQYSLKDNGELDQEFAIVGIADVLRPDTVFELKFTSELQKEHYLQCACYMLAFNIETGYLWNIKTNSLYAIQIPDHREFMRKVVYAITQGKVTRFRANITYDFKFKKKQLQDVAHPERDEGLTPVIQKPRRRKLKAQPPHTETSSRYVSERDRLVANERRSNYFK